MTAPTEPLKVTLEEGLEAYARESGVTREMVRAVPDLLEALEGLLDALPSATTHPAIQAAHAAIAKAKGERS